MFNALRRIITAPFRAVKAIIDASVEQCRQRDALIRIVDQLKADDAQIRKVFVDLAALAHKIQGSEEIQ